jgi:uncharacterized protein (TIGR00297 family)
LSRYQKARKRQVAAEKFDKGARRDIWQALANGGVGALLAMGHALWPTELLFFAFVGVMATVNADTWATEIGVLSARPPRSITTFRVVEAGTSGGVSPLGLLATLGGGLVIGLAAVGAVALGGALGGSGLAALCGSPPGAWLLLPLAGVLGGLAGSLFDSLLGATVQVMYFSPTRNKETEKRIDPDGTPNEYLRGLRWMSNDAVNLLSSMVGGAVAAGVFLGLCR